MKTILALVVLFTLNVKRPKTVCNGTNENGSYLVVGHVGKYFIYENGKITGTVTTLAEAQSQCSSFRQNQ